MAQKEAMVRNIFKDISRNYDLFDSLMSFGMDRRWRRIVVDMLNASDGMKFMDVGAGSGKTSKEIVDRFPSSHVEAVDITKEMYPGGLRNVNFNLASAESLPFQDGSFQRIVSCFLTRNVDSLQKYFQEAYRCLEDGGIFGNMDIFDPGKNLISPLFRIYFYKMMPPVMDRASRSSSYSYLAGSVRKFIGPEKMKAMLLESGFKRVEIRKLAGGTVYIHKCIK